MNIRARALLLAALGFLTPGLAHAQIQELVRCPWAPKQRPICYYVDKQRFESLVKEAVVELARLGTLEAFIPAIQGTINSTREAADKLAKFDSTLRDLKTPQREVSRVFAAAWNLAHPTAAITLSASGTTITVNAAALADSAVKEIQATNDPAIQMAARLGILASSIPSAGASRDMASQLGALYEKSGRAIDTNKKLVENANQLSARVRSGAGMKGESEAQVLSSKGQLDLMRGMVEGQRQDGVDATAEGLKAAQQARRAKTKVLQDMALRHGPARP